MTDRIERTVQLKAPVERVWRALTDHREFGDWFRVKLDGPFAPGAEATGRITHPGYEHVIWRARIKEITPHSLFSFTWHPYAVDAEVDYAKETPTLVEFRLEPAAGGTRLTIVESGFDNLPAHRREAALRMNGGGWTQQVQNIKAHVDA
jgi:uncharacterized protein YndB with AHSA1/START domain